MPIQNCMRARYLNTTPILVTVDGSSLVSEGIRR